MITSIQLKLSTKQRLAKLGSLSSTYDSVITDLLDHIEKCPTFAMEDEFEI